MTLLASDVRRTPVQTKLTAAAATRQVLSAITNAGGRPYLVGGAVRDALVNPDATPKDIDIEVFDLPLDALVAALSTVGYVDQVGRAFAVLKMRRHGLDFDISLPRREVKTGDGHRAFAVTPDPACPLPVAAARRDFTLNALMYDPADGTVLDCFGGLDDLRAGVLRHTSSAFAEDPLRVLRAMQLAARFDYRLHPDTAAIAATLAGAYPQLSVERVWGEWHKLATRGRHISAALEVLVASGWDVNFPQLAALHAVPQDPTWHPEGDVWAHAGLAGDAGAALADEAGLTGDDRAVIVLAALLHDLGKPATTTTIVRDGISRVISHDHDEQGVAPAREFLRAIGAPAHITAQVLPLIAEHMASVTTGKVSPTAVRRLARRLAPASIEQWALVVVADKGGRGTASARPDLSRWLELADQVGTRTSPARGLLNGRHLIAAGLTPGPVFKDLLARAVSAQDDGAFDDEAGALAWLGTQLAQELAGAGGR